MGEHCESSGRWSPVDRPVPLMLTGDEVAGLGGGNWAALLPEGKRRS